MLSSSRNGDHASKAVFKVESTRQALAADSDAFLICNSVGLSLVKQGTDRYAQGVDCACLTLQCVDVSYAQVACFEQTTKIVVQKFLTKEYGCLKVLDALLMGLW